VERDISNEAELKIYIVFKRNTNFHVQFQKSDIVIYLNLKMGTVEETEYQKI
jgi:predicted transport protein